MDYKRFRNALAVFALGMVVVGCGPTSAVAPKAESSTSLPKNPAPVEADKGALVSTPPPAVSAEPIDPAVADAKAEIKKQYDVWTKAMTKLTKNVMLLITTKDFVWKESGAAIPIKSLNDDYNQMLHDTKAIPVFDIKIVEFSADKGTATVKTDCLMDTVLIDIDTKKEGFIRSKYKTTDTWVKDGNKWKMKVCEITFRQLLDKDNKVTLDDVNSGKPQPTNPLTTGGTPGK